MKSNFKPNKVAFLDFETQSEYDLTKGTMRKYAKHPSTKALTCCVKVDGQMIRMGPYLTDSDKQKLQAIAAENTLVAHNAPFDATIWEEVLKLPEAEWFDTLPCARAAGLPGGLDKLSKAVGGRGKHKDGERLIQMLCCVKPGKVPAPGPAYDLLMEYNVQDVDELELVYNRVKDYGEHAVMIADRAINDRGIPIDNKLLKALYDMYEQNSKMYGAEFKEATEDVNPRSPVQVRKWLLERGIKLDSVGKTSVQQFLAEPNSYISAENPPSDDILTAAKEALELRRELAGVGKGKVDAALRLLDGDRIYDQFVYCGAGPGRWSSRGLQLHNMPSALKAIDMRDVPANYEAVSTCAKEASKVTKTHVTISDCLNVMLRRIVKADNLLVADYGAVEARFLAWIADEPTMLAAFFNPKESLYLKMGDTVFGRRINKKEEPLEYVLCKALVLGCGYGMSGDKFRETCLLRESREFVRMLDEANINLSDSVKLYRKTYPRVPKLWTEMHEAVHSAVGGRPTHAGKCNFLMVNDDLHCVLPSGRPIVYRNARIEPRVPGYCKRYNMPEIPVPTVLYDGIHGNEGFLYGGKIVENVCQGGSRDLIADALVKCESASIPVILHVHDEIVCEAPANRFTEMMEIMSVGPDWSKGMPILVEGYSGPQWTKNAEGYQEMKMLKGVEV